MSSDRVVEFRALVKAAHDAIDEYAESRLSGGDWFERDLDGAARNAVTVLLAYGVQTRPERTMGLRVKGK